VSDLGNLLEEGSALIVACRTLASDPYTMRAGEPAWVASFLTCAFLYNDGDWYIYHGKIGHPVHGVATAGLASWGTSSFVYVSVY